MQPFIVKWRKVDLICESGIHLSLDTDTDFQTKTKETNSSGIATFPFDYKHGVPVCDHRRKAQIISLPKPGMPTNFHSRLHDPVQ